MTSRKYRKPLSHILHPEMSNFSKVCPTLSSFILRKSSIKPSSPILFLQIFNVVSYKCPNIIQRLLTPSSVISFVDKSNIFNLSFI